MLQGTAAHEWQNVFFLAAVIPVSGWIAYMVLGDATERDWAKTREDDITSDRPEGQDNAGYIKEEGIGRNQPSFKLREMKAY